MLRRPVLALLLSASALHAQNADWPVYGGDPANTHYSKLSQIAPSNVRQLTEAWRHDTHDEFKGSEMQSNPIVVDGVLYASTPRLRIIALDAATGRQLWSFDPTLGKPSTQRFRHRGVVVTGDHVLFTHRNWLWALDKHTGKPITTAFYVVFFSDPSTTPKVGDSRAAIATLDDGLARIEHQPAF